MITQSFTHHYAHNARKGEFGGGVRLASCIVVGLVIHHEGLALCGEAIWQQPWQGQSTLQLAMPPNN